MASYCREYTAVIGDSEPEYQNQIAESLRKLGVVLIGIRRTGLELLNVCRELRPDIVIMDISLDQDNFNICHKLLENEIQLILTTQSNSINISNIGYVVGAIDILSKPMSPERFIHAIQCGMKRSAVYHTAPQRNVISNRYADNYILFNWKNKNYLVSIEKVVCIEKVADKKCQLLLSDNSITNCNSTLKELHAQSPNNLIFAHKGCLINRNFIDKTIPDILIQGNYEVRLLNFSKAITMSRRYYSHFLKMGFN